MKGKYITTNILMACLSHKAKQPDIHQQLKETIATHAQIMKQYFTTLEAVQPDIHAQLKQTIAAHQKMLRRYFEAQAAVLYSSPIASPIRNIQLTSDQAA